MEAYVSALLKEIEEQGDFYGGFFYVNSIFIGGGTPTALSAEQLARILTGLTRSFRMLRGCEITIEANPGTLDKGKLETCLFYGANRLSIGLQSLDNAHLKTLGRIHTKEMFLENYQLARNTGFDNINLDLMFAFPGQTLAGWRDTLAEAVSLRPEHISFYSLQLEEGTPLWDAVHSGAHTVVDEETDRAMYHHAVRFLKDAGYTHYEISNAAKPGFQCCHNLKYWSLAEYLGLGLGAHSYVDGNRFSNQEDLDGYIQAVEEGEGETITVWEHANSLEEEISEFIFLGLRKMEGISLEEFFLEFQEDIFDRFEGEITDMQRDGLVELSGGMLRLTPKGIDVSNRVFVKFV
jgi:oxygen-independent coproporphyrinogen-3 oxidase